ncbi:hypothetical protein [Massilia sp. Root335]|uniref:hypothetical protein n=1 Tax=Massilia sp. Root335 TaxID=1736517 RepID=UPI000B14AA6A|nr:hypothetical protein [Massilia sp. Root335]
MANLWRLKQNLVVDNDVKWPAVLNARFELTPLDFYRRDADTPIKTSIFGPTKMEYDGRLGRVVAKETGLAPPLEHEVNLSNGFLKIHGNNVEVEITVDNLDHAAASIDWLIRVFSEFLSVELKTYCDLHDINGTIDQKPFSLIYTPDGMSVSLFNTDPFERFKNIDRAFSLVDPNSPSYMRFVTCSSYFHQALRLMSPYQVNFAPDITLPEVLLNLAKCIELLFPSSNRDDLRKKLLMLGYSKEQIESQLISIIVVRNEIDVGHPLSGLVNQEEITALRVFTQRAIENVQAMLKKTAANIRNNTQFLAPLTNSGASSRSKLIEKLTRHLETPSLSEG